MPKDRNHDDMSAASSKKGKSKSKSPKPKHRSVKRSHSNKASKASSSTRSDRSSHSSSKDILDVIPNDYLRHPDHAEPILHYLPKMVAHGEKAALMSSKKSSGGGGNMNSRFPRLQVLLSAAEDDIRLHRARVQAAKNRDPTLLRIYKIETDAQWLARQQRLNERELMLKKLETERAMILKELGTDTKGLTAQEKTQVQLARWQRLLELYVYTPEPPNNNNDNNNNKKKNEKAEIDPEGVMDFLGVLKYLLEGTAEVRADWNVLSYDFLLRVASCFLGWLSWGFSHVSCCSFPYYHHQCCF